MNFAPDRRSSSERAAVARVASVLLTAGLVIGLSTSPAIADVGGSEQAEANGIAHQVAEAAPDGAVPVEGEQIGDEVTATAGATETTVALDASDGIEVSLTVEGEPLAAAITLPTELEVGEGVVADDGTVVYAADDSGAKAQDAIAVQTLSDGSTRVQTVIADQNSAHALGYSMPGFLPAIDDSGNAAFIGTGDSTAFVPVEPAWAVDATGASVATHYELRGTELVQIVTPDAGTVYPVVADPTWVWIAAGWGMKLSRSETSRVRDYGAASGMCAIFTRGAPGVAIGCAVWSSYIQAQANLAEGDRPKRCLFFNVIPAPGTIWRVTC
jgi:hypothetical protein